MKRLTFGLGLLAAAVVAVLTAAAAPGKPPPPSLAWSPTSHGFGTVAVGNTGTKEFTLTFAGKGTSGPLSVSLGGSPSYSTAADNCNGVTLSTRTPTCTVTVQYAPTSAGQSDTGYLYASSRKITNETRATLTGTGQAATLPSLSIDSPLGCANCGSGPYVITFTVSMSHTSGTNVTFDWAATDDSATWGTTCDKTCDYTSTTMSGNGTITAGSTSTTIVFGLCADGPGFVFPYPHIKFTVTISNPTGATIATDTGTGDLRIS